MLTSISVTDYSSITALAQRCCVYTPSAQESIIVWRGKDCILGFAAWRTAADEAELLSIAVDAAVRGQGIGAALLEAAISAWRTSGAMRGFLEVRSGNTAAQILYRRAGFVPVGMRKQYYLNLDGSSEDAVVMKKDLT